MYLGNRDSGTVVTLDGENSYGLLWAQTVSPCGGPGSSPYSVGFNPANRKLYVACAPVSSVDRVVVYQADSGGLHHLADLDVGDGGSDGGGGIAINANTGNVFFTNSAANTVTVIGGDNNQVRATLSAGPDPFGAAVDSATGRVFIADRGSDGLHVLLDEYTP